jgi:hypothetical protein
MIQLLIRQFGRDREAILSNEGLEYGEILCDYHTYTLQECLERVDYGLRVLYIHRLYREEDEDFYERHLRQHLCGTALLRVGGPCAEGGPNARLVFILRGTKR